MNDTNIKVEFPSCQLEKPIIYGITGRKGHGKDSVAKFLLKKDSTFFVTHFGDAMKEMTTHIFGLTKDQLYDQTQKEVPFPQPLVLDLFVPAMKAETGLDIQPVGKVATSPREVLQFFATEYVRHVQDDYWVQRLISTIKDKKRILVPDVRFPNEAAAIRAVGGKIVKVVKTDVVEIGGHASEAEVDNIEPDVLLGVKTGDMEGLERLAQALL
jgi:hypothetical protein